MKNCILGTMLFSLFPLLLVAQPPDTLWTRTYGGIHEDGASAVKVTSDNGYVIAGSTLSFGAGGFDIYVIRTDSLGNVEWTKTYGGPEDDVALCVVVSSDGGYLLIGRTHSYGNGMSDVYLIRTNSLGDTLWTKTYGDVYYDGGIGGIQIQDGGFAIVGYTQRNGIVYQDVWLLRTNSVGDTMWTGIYDFHYDDAGYSILQTEDGGYVFAGTTYWYMGFDVLVAKTDSNGLLQWSHNYGTGNYDYGTEICQTTNHEYVVAGASFQSNGYEDVYVLKLNSTGDTLWTKTYGGDLSEAGLSMQLTPNNGSIIVGSAVTDTILWNEDAYIIKIDAQGEKLWERTYGGTANERGDAVALTPDGGYIITGYTSSYGAGDSDVWLLKIAQDTFGIAEHHERITTINAFGSTILNGPLIVPEGKKCRVFDITGRVVMLDKMKPGIYFVEIDDHIVQKVIKVR